MQNNEVEVLELELLREKRIRKVTEAILGRKTAEIYGIPKGLKDLGRKLRNETARIDYDFNSLLDAYVVIDLSGDVIKMSHSAKELLGYDEDKETVNLLKLVKEKDIDYTVEAFRELVIQGTFKNYRATIFTKDNQKKNVEVNANIIYDNDGEAIAAQGIVRDITMEININQKLKESEERLNAVITNLDNGVLLEDEDRKIILTNSNFCNIFSIAAQPEDLKGMDCANSAEETKFLFTEPKKFVQRIKQLLHDKTPVFGDELALKDGRILKRNYIPIFEKKTFKGHLWNYLDITLKKKYNEGIKAENEKYSNIINNMNLGLIEANTEGYITYANNSISKSSGYSKHSLAKMKPEDLVFLDEESIIDKIQRSKRKLGNGDSYEIRVKTKENQIKNLLVSDALNYDLNGLLIGTISIYLDITEQKKINDRLNEYAHVVSHDLKAPLRNISTLLSWTREDFKKVIGNKGLKNLDLIQRSVEKMDQFIVDLLQYSSIDQKELKMQQVDLNETIQVVLESLHAPPHFNIVLLRPLPFVLANPTQLKQIFLNLLSNAIKYNDKEKGEIEIDFIENNSFYTFSVKDNGIGIAKDDQKKIFEIFTSLNNTSHSSGIGLNIVKRILELYNGRIWVESYITIGSTFYFIFKKPLYAKK
jgi:PAS domain S-box-containing protein